MTIPSGVSAEKNTVMIDLHSHILPGLDDGAASPEITERMLRIASREGIKKIAATPHGVRDLEHYRQVWSEWRTVAIACGIELIPGMEYDFGFLAEWKRRHQSQAPIQMLNNGRFLLVDFAAPILPPNWHNTLVGDMVDRGARVLVAHPERLYPDILEVGAEFIDEGAFLQVNAGSLLGHYGPGPRNSAFRLLENGLCHIIAGDVHNLRGKRWPLTEVRDLLTKRYGAAPVECWLEENPLRILNNELPHRVTPKRPWYRHFFSFF